MHKRRKTLAFAAAGLSALMALTACSGGGDGAEEKKEVTWVINSLPAAWGAISSAGGSVYVIQMLSGVIPFTGQYQPDATYEYNMDVLAEEPELINDNPDEGPFQYSFTLAEDAVWSDGTPMTGEDLRVTMMMSASPDEGYCTTCDSRGTTSADMVDKVEVDGKTATFTLKEGLADPEWMGMFDAHSVAGGFYPAHLAEEQGFDVEDPDQLGEYYTWLHETRPEWSGGPYKIVDGDLKNQVVKEPNPEWFGETQPALDRIIMPYNTDEGTFIPAFQNGEIDGANPAQYSADIVTQLQDMEATLSIAEGNIWEHVDINVDNEWLSDVELRKAVFTAINRDEIASRNFGSTYPDYELKNNHIFSSQSEYFEDHLSDTTQGDGDIEAAKKILEDAGYELDGGTLTLDGEEVGPFRLRSTDTVTRSNSLQLIQAQLDEIGVKTTIEMTDDLGTMLGEQDFDIVQFGWSGSQYFASNAEQFWHSESESNFGGFSNEDVDKAAEASATASGLDEAAKHANTAVETIVPEAYVLPIMAEPNYFFASERLANVEDNLQSSYRATYNIGEWDIAE
ncbi:peptide/nickel transport system substrate-binding protein [Nocardiopsis arvandica]|uniref:Peptide/nickel transport system substrate-binding protein n=1 Tax=Nocardiopsis sinuspersici TaxID=501010 RepID=A0A7Z0BJE9_9ACTN|nr:ABC transporter family substrate-binding protein [Nocardiopsis sinuspersici]NYH53041.1 peptide/nickel transport system substrate-binding protein [Nocardiopsis sinuspersici]